MSDDDAPGLGLVGPEPPLPVRRVRADALARADRAWAHRVAGHTWQECAEVAGFAHGRHAIDAVRHAFGATPVIDREEHRRLWRDRLEAMWQQSVADMADRVPGAVTAAVRVAGLAVQMDGLAEPAKVDVTVSEQFDQLLKGLEGDGLLGS